MAAVSLGGPLSYILPPETKLLAQWGTGLRVLLSAQAWFTDGIAKLKADAIHWSSAQLQHQLSSTYSGHDQSVQLAEFRVMLTVLVNSLMKLYFCLFVCFLTNSWVVATGLCV